MASMSCLALSSYPFLSHFIVSILQGGNFFDSDPYSKCSTQVAFRQSNIRIKSRLLYVATRSSQKLSCPEEAFQAS